MFPDDALTDDAFLGGRLHLWQPQHGYRAATDPVLLAAACPAKPGQSVLDLGCGTGADEALLQARYPKSRVVGVDVSMPMLRAGERAQLDKAIKHLLRADVPEPKFADAGGVDEVEACEVEQPRGGCRMHAFVVHSREATHCRERLIDAKPVHE